MTYQRGLEYGTENCDDDNIDESGGEEEWHPAWRIHLGHDGSDSKTDTDSGHGDIKASISRYHILLDRVYQV